MSQFRFSTLTRTLAALAVCLWLCFGAAAARGEILTIPPDQKTMPPLNEAYYLSDRLYEDPSIRVEITEGRAFDTDYLVARVKIANASQLRSYVHKSKDGVYPNRMAKILHSVLAITGDSFKNNKMGSTRKYEVRQGKLVFKQHWNDHCFFDILMLDDQGDFHILKTPTYEETLAYIEANNILNTFYFGPALIINGEVQPAPEGTRANGVGWNRDCQRQCFCQLGPLEYMIVTTGGPDHANCKGLTGDEFVQLILAEGPPVAAYNLDGGTAAWLVFREEKINLFGLGPSVKKKPVDDLIYFASAWQN